MAIGYEVLSPWAEADPVPLKGITPRVKDLNGKNIGLFSMVYKKASRLIINAVEKKLKEQFPEASFSLFEHPYSLVIADMEKGSENFQISPEFKGKFENWVKGVDAVVGAVGD